MSWDRKKPWTAPARTLVVYRTERGWRFAIYNEAGILDGGLPDVPTDASPELAQADLLRKVEEESERTYVASWSSDKPDWWYADLTTKRT